MNSLRKITFYTLLVLKTFNSLIVAASDNLFIKTNADCGFTTTVTNVGQGNGIKVFDNNNGRMMIVDAGSSCLPEKQFAESIIPTFLAHVSQKLSLGSVTIVVSHPDKDHLSWVKKILETPALNTNKNVTVYLGGNFEKYLTSSEAKALLNTLLTRSSPTKIHSLSHALTVDEMKNLRTQVEQQNNESTKNHGLGYEDIDSAVIQTVRMATQLVQKVRPFIVRSKIDGFDDFNRVNVEILGANAGHTPTKVYPLANGSESFINDTSCLGGVVINPDENTNSIVLRITFYNNRSITITGDATGITTNQLIINYPASAKGTELNCDLLIACHHGSITEESNNPIWVQATQPKWVIFSAGKYDSYHHPQFDAVWNYTGSQRLEKAPSHPILCARIDTRVFPSAAETDKRGITYSTAITTGTTGKQRWLDNIRCTLGVYSTHSSGTIVFNVTSDGVMTMTSEK